MSLQTTLSAISSFVWGPPLLILLSGTGLYLTLRLGFLQIRYLPRALGYLFARGANKGLDNKVKADKNKVQSKIFLFLTALFSNQKRKAGHCLPLSILIITKSLLLLLPRYPR